MRDSLKANVVAVSATVAGVLPLFLLGGLSVFVREDLDFGVEALGLAVSVYFATSAISSSPVGSLVEGAGYRRGMIGSVSTSALVLMAMGLLANRWWHLVALLAVAGLANAITQVASNLLLARVIAGNRQGIAYGVKQSAIPIATLVAGASVGTVAVGLGWRHVFLLAGLLAIAVAVAVLTVREDAPAVRRRASGSPLTSLETRALVVLAVGTALASGAANGLGAFLVESAVRWVTQEQAGLALALGSVAGICARVGSGWLVDRARFEPLRLVVAQLFVAIVGYAWLAVADTQVSIVLAAMLAFASGWGWTGVLIYAVASRHPRAPAKATGIAQAGIYTGAVVGPTLFGLVADRVSYTTAWGLAAVAVAASAMVMVFGARRMETAVLSDVSVESAPTHGLDIPEESKWGR